MISLLSYYDGRPHHKNRPRVETGELHVEPTRDPLRRRAGTAKAAKLNGHLKQCGEAAGHHGLTMGWKMPCNGDLMG